MVKIKVTMKKYVCVKDWARNRVGQVIDEYVYKRYPEELRVKCFKLVEPVVESKPPSPPPVVSVPVEPVSEPVRVESDVEVAVVTPSDEDQDGFDKKFRKKLPNNLV